MVFTYDLIADPDVASNWQSDAAGIDRVEQDGARKVTFHFKEPRNPVLQQGMTIRGIVPKHVLGGAERSGLRAHPYGRNPVSSGPFRVASWKTDERIILEPNAKQEVQAGHRRIQRRPERPPDTTSKHNEKAVIKV